MSAQPFFNRRRVLQAAGLAAVAGWVWGAPRLGQIRSPALEFAPIPGTPYRRLVSTGPVSGINAALVGVADGSTTAPVDLCAALGGDEIAAITVFWDASCPNCPQMEEHVAQSAPDMVIRHRAFPILGPSSEYAARAVVAAALQGDSAGLRTALVNGRGLPDAGPVRVLASELGYDTAQLARDIATPSVAADVEKDRAVAARLGLFGTPAVVIGSTVLQGVLPQRTIRQIIALEMAAGAPCS